MTFAGARFRFRFSFVLVVGASGACFNPSDSNGGSGTDETGSTSATSASTVSQSSTDADSTSATPPTSSADDTTSTTAPTDTTEATLDGTDGSSTGEVSDCPGGAPTPGDAPYVLTTVIAAQDTNSVDVGDINGDGHLDLINISRADTSVETFFGDGAGGFASDGVTMLDMGGYPDTVRLGAIADDTVDLFVHMEGPVELWVVRGDGAGNWPNPQVYTGTYVRAIDLADFNGDDVLDLAYVGASNMEIRLGEPTETYDAPVLYGENFGNVLRAADISGDGNLDVLTANYGTTELEIYSGAGDGTFAAQPTLVTGSPISGIDVGHLDGDELLDLVLSTEDDLRVFYGERGGGVSTTPGTIIAGSLGRVRVVDVDADGVEDLVTHASSSVEIRFAAGDTTFSDAVPFACSAYLLGLAIGDLNEDCVPDLVAPLGAGEDLCVLMSDRD
ncbi:MAG TPA: VCBS repeat-containing protein [Nannocystaceae bacterium]|nr:VCBS repeat-containing protein [Nannocystaceae bacterium]